MQRGIEKGKQSEHTPQADQPGPAGQTTQWRHRQGDQQQTQRPIAGRMGDGLHRIGANAAVQALPYQEDEREQTGDEQRRLDDAQDALGRRSHDGTLRRQQGIQLHKSPDATPLDGRGHKPGQLHDVTQGRSAFPNERTTRNAVPCFSLGTAL